MVVIKVNYSSVQPVIKVNYDETPIYISTTVDAVYIKVDYGTGGVGAVEWGDITGTLSNQTDLQTALNNKFDDPTGTTSQYIRGDGSLATFPSLTGFVPYTGATTNVDLGEYELRSGQLTLDTSPTGTATVGTTRWNDTIGSSETTLKGGSVILKNGVDLVARVVNKVTPNTTLTKAAYQAVKVSGAQGQRLAISLAQANNDNNSADTLGLVTETIATNQEGFIMTVGTLEGINTTGNLQGETWADGDVLYLSPTTPGALTNIKPNGSTGHIVVIGYVEYAHANNGKIYVKIMNGWELTELHDTFISSPANNEVLTYESSTSLWKNKSVETALGYTPVPTTRTLTINGTSYDLSQNRSWTVTGDNIYTADGTLSSNRTVSLGAFSLSFDRDINIYGHRIGRGNSGLSNNVIFGNLAGSSFTTSQGNVAIGDQSLKSKTTGNFNTSVGRWALNAESTGAVNTSIGASSLVLLNGGSYNTALGGSAGGRLSSGDYNIFIGYSTSPAGILTSGSYNTIIGSQVNVGVSTLSNNIILADGQGNIRIRAFNTGNVTIGGSTDISSAKFEISSTTSGFLPPRMTETQKNAISTPATGLVIYQTDGTEGLYENTSTGWRILYNTPSGGSGITRSVNNISTTTTAGSAASTDYVYLISGTTTLTLPTAVGNTNRYTLKNVGTNTVTINTTSSQTIDGSTSITMAVQYTAIDVISDGTNWNII